MADPERTAPAKPPSRPPPPRPSLGWLALAVVAVIAAVAWARMGRDDGGDEEPHEIGAGAGTGAPAAPERLVARVIHTYPHAPDAFTQGLLWHEGHLYESTGLHRRSSVREVDLESGEVLRRRDIEDPQIFAEGLARVGDRLFQITWQENRAFVYGLRDFSPIREFTYEGEGWGLCFDGEHLVMSDGSDRLFFRDPETFEVERTVHVRDRGRPVDQLNELECVDGAVWSNVWQTDQILRIDPATGRVTAIVDARGLLTEEEQLDADVLNGIAWIPERGHFVITGKEWPHLFEVELVPRAGRRD